MKEYVIQLETHLSITDVIKIVNKYEKIGAIKLKSVLLSQKDPQYLCKSYVNDNGDIIDCTCGECTK